MRNTMKLERSFVENEDESKLMWPANSGAMYSVINKDSKNKYGEYRGYRIMPGMPSALLEYHPADRSEINFTS